MRTRIQLTTALTMSGRLQRGPFAASASLGFTPAGKLVQAGRSRGASDPCSRVRRCLQTFSDSLISRNQNIAGVSGAAPPRIVALALSCRAAGPCAVCAAEGRRAVNRTMT